MAASFTEIKNIEKILNPISIGALAGFCFE
jgi:hypothetical protein